MKQQWELLRVKLEALSLRERVMIFVAGIALAGFLSNTLFLQPLHQRQKIQAERILQQQDQLRDTSIKLADLLQASRNAAGSPQRDKIVQLRKQLAEGEAFLRGWGDRLVPPEQMASLLEQVLGKNTSLQLVSLQTLAPESLISAAAEAGGKAPARPAATSDQQVFKHGVQIAVRGSYADLSHYLTQLEALPSQMYWGRAQLKVEQHPAATLTLTVYTLSLDKTWLAL
jgi:MSHA biogenesis protein MshJ